MLMLRPSFPPFYHQSQLPGSFPESDVVAIVHDTWKVGDLVDWSFDGCYWSGAITDVLEHGKVKVNVPFSLILPLLIILNMVSCYALRLLVAISVF